MAAAHPSSATTAVSSSTTGRRTTSAATALRSGAQPSARATLAAKLAEIISNSCDDFQRGIYYCLAGRGVVEMADAMDWLLAMLKARA